ncbi:MAG: hypothetical protein NW203_03480 [Hyphomonadaceae bacterium]|nr:hypothetical protein [Hyphomonadaceae bacterium]
MPDLKRILATSAKPARPSAPVAANCGATLAIVRDRRGAIVPIRVKRTSDGGNALTRPARVRENHVGSRFSAGLDGFGGDEMSAAFFIAPHLLKKH